MTKQLLESLQAGLGLDLVGFFPELVLCFTIVFLLLIRLVPYFDWSHLGWVALVLTLCALVFSWFQWMHAVDYDPRVTVPGGANHRLDLFSGLLVFDNFSIFIKLFLLGFTALIILLCLITGIPDREDSADFFCLLLGATLGMSVMASANHLLMVFIGIEMASVPSYALAGFLKGRRQSSEASLKYVVYGGGAAGIMLYGISLLAGKFGTGYLPDLVQFMAATPLDPVVLLGTLFVLIGIGFKLAAVPFHFWCPDVFEGASAEVAGFLSVASKGAALALLARITLGLGGFTAPLPGAEASWKSVAPILVPALAVFAALTTTFGNLAAYRQTNLKRLLAYSTIAHAGFMMMGLATLTREGAGAVLFYLMVYLFMNLGAFAVVAYLRNLTGSEDLSSFRGLIHRSPVLVITLGVFLLSLLGMPPLGGFSAKFQIFMELYNGATRFADTKGSMPGGSLISVSLYSLLVIGALNTVLSLFYYVKVLKVMVLEKSLEEVEGRPVEAIGVPHVARYYVSLLAMMILFLGIYWGPLAAESKKGLENFQPTPTAAAFVAGGPR
jgi:NADH-quinone oxidoreductase subunit N